MVAGPRPPEPNAIDGVDLRIVETLRSVVPSAGLSYAQALYDLQSDSCLSWRGPAADLREALRETLDYLAPDDEVAAMAGYRQDPNVNGPTMKQKVHFVLKKRGASKAFTEPAEAATEAIDSTIGTFVRSVYTRSNVSTHTPTQKAEVARTRDFVRVVLCELLEIRP
jgi:Predicted pPIWI-associating nuclease